jgi:hypothetical protein
MDQTDVSKEQMSLSKHIEMSSSPKDEKNYAQDAECAGPSAEHLAKVEKKVVLKQDLSIVLLLAGCYFFAYLVCASR